MSISIPKTRVNLLFLEKILLALLVVFLSLPNILPQTGRMVSVFLILLLMIHTLSIIVNGEKTAIPASTPLFVWLVFYLYVLVDRGPIFTGTDKTWALNFFCIFTYLLLNSKRNPEIVLFFIKTLEVVELFNALATIIFWVFPDLYPIYENAFLSDQLRIAGRGYRSGLTSHYSTNGMLIELGLLSSFSLLSSNEKKHKIFFGVYLLALVLTTKRAHLFFGLAACMTGYWFSSRNKSISKRMKYVLLIVLLLVIWYIAAQFFPDLGRTLVRFEITEDTLRQSYRIICIELFQQHPLLGNGWEAFTNYLYGTYLGDSLVSWENTTQNAHNVYFQVLAEQGFIGEILFLAAVLITFLYSVKKLLQINQVESQDTDRSSDLICLRLTIAIQTFFILYCLTGNPLYDNIIYIPLFLSFGICCCLANREI